MQRGNTLSNTKAKHSNDNNSDSELLFKYAQKLNEVIETNKELEEKIKESEKINAIFKKQLIREKETLICENEDILRRVKMGSFRKSVYGKELIVERYGLVVNGCRKKMEFVEERCGGFMIESVCVSKVGLIYII